MSIFMSFIKTDILIPKSSTLLSLWSFYNIFFLLNTLYVFTAAGYVNMKYILFGGVKFCRLAGSYQRIGEPC